MQSPTFWVLGAGAVLLDSVVVIDGLPVGDIPGVAAQRYPPPGEKLRAPHNNVVATRDTVARSGGQTGGEFFDQLGGPVPTALSLHRGTGSGVVFLGAVGDDTIGFELRKQLLNRDFVLPLPPQLGADSGVSQVFLDAQSGHRSILYASGTLSRICADDLAQFPDVLAGIDLVQLDAREPEVVRVMGPTAKGRGIPVYLDAGDFKRFTVGDEELSTLDLLPHVDYVQLPRRAAVEVVREADSRHSGTGDFSEKHANPHGPDLNAVPLDILAETLLRTLDVRSTDGESAVIPVIIVTDGDRGAAYAQLRGDTIAHGHIPAHIGPIPAFPDRVVDENGAGDLFAGAMAAAILRGVPIEMAAQIASLVAASKTRCYGNQTFLSYHDAENISARLPARGRMADAVNRSGQQPPTPPGISTLPGNTR